MDARQALAAAYRKVETLPITLGDEADADPDEARWMAGALLAALTELGYTVTRSDAPTDEWGADDHGGADRGYDPMGGAGLDGDPEVGYYAADTGEWHYYGER